MRAHGPSVPFIRKTGLTHGRLPVSRIGAIDQGGCEEKKARSA
jgi:hypothetical protein